ncbi:MAG: hypothetical protein QOJ35_486 [Solirubrobacteraceae bacterium]|nr:hypothetical protein [Solirubrobacteraceae bacterium]
MVACRDRDANQLDVVGDLDGEQRQDRGALVLPEGAKPRSCRRGVACGQRLEREEPRSLAPEAGWTLVDGSPRELGREAREARVTGVDRDASQRDDTRDVEDALVAVGIIEAELPLEDRRGVGQSSRLFATNSVLRGTEEFDDFLTRPNNTVEIADGDD